MDRDNSLHFKPRRGETEYMNIGDGKMTVLEEGELFVEYPSILGPGSGKHKIKVGDGESMYFQLPYALGDTSTDPISFTQGTETTVEESLNKVTSEAELNKIIGNLKQAVKLCKDDIDSASSDASLAVKNITRNGLTFTATRLDGTLFTFDQQDNNTTYIAGAGLVLDHDGTNNLFKAKLRYEDPLEIVASRVSGDTTQTYVVELDADGFLCATVPWHDTTYSVGEGLTLSITHELAAKLRNYTSRPFATTTKTTVVNREYPVGIDSDGYLSVNIPWLSFSKYKVGTDVIEATSLEDTFEFVAGSCITLNPDSDNDKLTIINSGVREVQHSDNNGYININTNGTTANIRLNSVHKIVESSTNGYITVTTDGNTADVFVHGLGSRAFDSTEYLPLIAGGVVQGATTFSNTMNIKGATTLDNTLTVGNASTFSGTIKAKEAVTMDKTLAVTGNTTVGGTLKTTGATTLSGAATLGSTLSVASNTTIGGTLQTTGASTFSGTINAKEAVTMDKTLAVTGNTTIGGTLQTTGASTFNGAIKAKEAVTMDKTLAVTGNTTIGGTLKTTGTSTFVGAIKANEAVTMDKTLAVTGNTTIGGTLKTTGASTFSNNVNIAGNLTVTGTTTYNDTMHITGAVTLDSTLTVGGASTFSGTIKAKEAVTMDKTLAVTGNTTVGGTLKTTGATTLSGAATLGSTLSVAGASTFSGDAIFNNGKMPLAAGKITGLASGTSRIYADGIAISNPTTANDIGFIRVTGTGEADTVLEIATGDDGGSTNCESIVVRQYNTSNVVAKEAKLLDTSGNTSFPGNLTIAGASTFSGAITGKEAVTLEKTLAVTGNTTIGGTLKTTGASTFSSTLYTAGNTTLGGTLSVTGATTLNSTATIKNLLTLYREGTTANNYPAGITFSLKDTTTGKTYNSGYIYAYQDHQSEPYGDNLVINPGGGLFIGSGEAPGAHYAAKGASFTNEDAFITADSSVYVQANGNYIANRLGFRVTPAHEIIPVKADVDTNNVGSIGTSTYKWGDIYATNIHADVSSATISTTGDVTIGGKLTVTGATALNSTLTVANGSTFSGTIKAKEAVTMDKTLAVTGNTTIGGTLKTTGATTLSGAATLSSTLAVASNATVGGTLKTTGASTFSGAITGKEAVTLEKTLAVTGNTTVGGTLQTTGASTFSGTIKAKEAVTMDKTLAVTGNTTVGGTLKVTGATTLSGAATLSSTLAVTSNATVGGTFQTTGASTFSGTIKAKEAVTMDKTLAVTGNTTVGGTLKTTGATTLTGAATLSSTMTVAGASTFSGDIKAKEDVTMDKTLAVTGNTTIGGTLKTTGASTFTGAMTVSGNLTGTNISGTIVGVKETSGTAGGIALYGSPNNVDEYGIYFRKTSNKGVHGYVTSDWATYFTMSNTNNRGWVFRRNGSGNVASIDTNGRAVFNESVTIGGNAANTSGARMEYNDTNECIDFVFV